MTVQVTIIGLSQTGASIGLALAEHKEIVQRVGNDREPNTAKQAEKIGAVERIAYNLPSSVRQADLVVLAVPVNEVRETLEVIAQDLKPGAVVIDTSDSKAAVARWAQELLPADRHFIAWTLVTNPAYLNDTSRSVEAAHADLLKDMPIMISANPGASPDAVRLATDLVTLIGATPLFSDSDEIDGLLASGRILPQLAAAALINATVDQPGWREARKLAGDEYAWATAPLSALESDRSPGKAALYNSANTVRMIDNMISALQDLRQAVADQDEKTLKDLIDHAVTERMVWLRQRQKSRWSDEEMPTTALPTSGEILGRLIGLGRKSGGRPGGKAEGKR